MVKMVTTFWSALGLFLVCFGSYLFIKLLENPNHSIILIAVSLLLTSIGAAILTGNNYGFNEKRTQKE